MKKKLVATLLAIASIICIAALSGCSSCLEFLFTFGRRPPKVSDIRESIYENWGIELPKNMTLIYFANTLGPRGDGCVYYELACEQIDDDFALLLSDEKNEEFETMFNSSANGSLNNSYYANTPEDFTLPDLSQNYLWLMLNVYTSNNNETLNKSLCVLYLPTQQKLCIAKYKL